MSGSLNADDLPARGHADRVAHVPPVAPEPALVKVGRILDEEDGAFGLEYDNTLGEKNTMRLDALTYDGAVREARSFLGIREDDHDEDGDRWAIE